VLAFADEREAYDGNLARFLNLYMQRHASDGPEKLDKLEIDLKLLANRARNILSKEQQRKLPLLLVEALLVAMYTHGDQLSNKTEDQLVNAYQAMRCEPSFNEGAKYAVTSAENVKMRLNTAVKSFDL
jgi:hypothetical protein